MQRGYPLITVSFDRNQSQFRITQKHYQPENMLMNDTSSWFVPLNFATTSNPNFDDTRITHYFEDDATEKIIAVTDMSHGDWFVFNKQQLNYYRVNYDAENWNAIIKVLNSDHFNLIHPLNRAQLVNDAIDLAENNIIAVDTLFGILKYLRFETDYVPWRAAFVYFYTIVDMFGGSNLVLNQFMKEMSTKFYEKFAVQDNFIPNSEPMMDRFGRDSAITWACTFGNERCLTDTFGLLQSIANRNQTVPRGLETVIICNGLRGTNKKLEWSNMWRKMRATKNMQERVLRMYDLGCSDDSEVMLNFLETSIASNSDVNYDPAERLVVFTTVAASSVGVPVILEFIKRYELEIPLT
jgi:aminopeptidase N